MYLRLWTVKPLKDLSKLQFPQLTVPYDRISVPTVVLETGIKVIDFSPNFKGSRVGLFGGAGVGKLFYYRNYS